MQEEYPRAKFRHPHIIAKLAAASGATDAAVRYFEEGIEFCTATGWEYFRCKCLLEYGIFLAGQDDPAKQSRAVSLLQEGLAVARQLDLHCTTKRFESALHRPCGTGRIASSTGLSSRELEVLSHMALGKRNREIARDLFISEYTVANHVSHIFSKLGVNNRSAAVAYAVEHSLARSS